MDVRGIALKDNPAQSFRAVKIALLAAALAMAGVMSSVLTAKGAALSALAVLLLLLVIRYKAAAFVILPLVTVSANTVGLDISRVVPGIIPYYDQLPLFFPFAICAYLGVLLAKWSRLEGRTENPLRAQILVLLGFSMLTLFYASDLYHSAFQWLLLLANVMAFLVIIAALSDQAIHRKVMWAWVMWGVVQGFAAFGLYFFERAELKDTFPVIGDLLLRMDIACGVRTYTGALRRGSAFFGHNGTALVMNLTLPVAFGLFMTESKKSLKLLLAPCMLIITGTNLLTMSRASLGAMLIMGAFLFFTLRKTRKHFFMLITAFTLGSLTLYYIESKTLDSLFMRESVTPRIFKMMSESNNKGIVTAKERIKNWKKGLAYSSQTFPLGLGVGNFKNRIRESTFPHAHSIYFSFFFDFGIVGVAILISIFAVVAKIFLTAIMHQSSYLQIMLVALAGGFVSAGIHGLVDFEYNLTLLWVYLGMTVATWTLVKKEIALTGKDGEPGGQQSNN